MRRPAGRKGRSPDADKAPPGGRALERVQQDRRARGLPSAQVPGTLSVDSDSPTLPRPRATAAKPASTAKMKTARRK